MSELHIGKGISLPTNIVTAKASILAMTGQGKTYLAKVIAEEMMKHNARRSNRRIRKDDLEPTATSCMVLVAAA